MKLSKRLQMVADCVTKGSIIADVGCDHAYLSIALVERGIALGSIALDVNKGPLQHASENISKCGMSDKIELRLSNGLARLLPGEADSIVAAGMGGGLMVRILKEGYTLVKDAKEVILQPQSEVFKVRSYLHSIGYGIVFEDMCIDDDKYYVVIKAMNGGRENENDEKVFRQFQAVEEEYGAYLLRKKHPVLKEYLHQEFALNQTIKENLKYALNGGMVRQNECRIKEQQIMHALSYYDEKAGLAR